jgi:hypothetical protein
LSTLLPLYLEMLKQLKRYMNLFLIQEGFIIEHQEVEKSLIKLTGIYLGKN